jgi:hypothetical protein
MCSVLLCLHVDQPASGSEEGGSQLIQSLKISSCCVLLVHSWVQDKGTHHCDLDQMWYFLGTSDAAQKVSFKNKFLLP